MILIASRCSRKVMPEMDKRMKRSKLLAQLNERRSPPRFRVTFALIYTSLGDQNHAIAALEHGFQEAISLLVPPSGRSSARLASRRSALRSAGEKMCAARNQSKTVKIDTFFTELKRRNVYKVAVAYIVGGWALSQGIAQVFPVFDVPSSVIRTIVLLIILGLPVALVFAWMFELTPQGIKRTETADAMPAAAKPKKYVWIYVVLISGAIFRSDYFFSVAIPLGIVLVRLAPKRPQFREKSSQYCRSKI